MLFQHRDECVGSCSHAAVTGSLGNAHTARLFILGGSLNRVEAF